MGSDITPERRMVVALLLSFVIYLGWGYYTLEKKKRLGPPPAAAVEQGLPKAAAGAALPAPVLLPQGAILAEQPEQVFELDTPEMHLKLTNRGGTLVAAQLKAPQYQRRINGKDEPVDLARATVEGRRPIETTFGGALAALPANAPYVATLDPNGRGVRFVRHEGAGTIEKHFTLVSPYLIALDVLVTGLSPDHLTLAYPSEQPPGSGTAAGIFGFGRTVPNVATGVCLVGGSVERGKGGRPGDIKVENLTLPKDGTIGDVGFAGLDERFFVGAIYPASTDRRGHCTVSSLATGSVEAALDLPLEAGKNRRFGIYLGPKDFDRLKAASVLPGELAPPAGLEKSVDFGFWTLLCVPMLFAMEIFHGFTKNWGLAIILLTLLIKLVLLPLQHRYFKAMQQMKELQPKIEALKKQHVGDKERLNLETMKLYSDNGANPFGSCLPMLVQLPIWFALYRLLGTTIQLYREPFITGWINDLTAPDPFYILPLGMGATMVVTQLLTPQTMENSQQKMLMWFMPAFFTLTFLKVPAGLSLYIFASNLLNIAQQSLLARRFRTTAVPAV